MSKNYASLSADQLQTLEALLDPLRPCPDPTVEYLQTPRNLKGITDQIVKKNIKYLKGDEADIRSVCLGAVLDAVALYPGRKPGEFVSLASRIMRNRLLNRSKELNRQKRGSGRYHVSIEKASAGEYREPQSDSNGPWWERHAHDSMNPLDRIIMREDAERAAGSLTERQQEVLVAALNADAGKVKRAAKKPWANLRVAQKATGASDSDMVAVKAVVRKLLS